ncbi:unnamed protein product [Rhizoctonia solani]|uniref:Uncharacterized protein n=1 Tax=Rhizoctonia solani TaxID=456999 RepID=A0A8H2WXQ5_9AGAM|nr:unnamed protein product [Rhizoctonia solani]
MRFKAMAWEWSTLPYYMVEELYQWVRRQMIRQRQSYSIALSNILESIEGGEQGEDIAKWTAGSMYNTGPHTIVSTLSNFILAMIQYPASCAREFVFGIGRRICPGNTVADGTVFLVTANLVAAMEVKRTFDRDGHKVEPEVMRTGGLVG